MVGHGSQALPFLSISQIGRFTLDTQLYLVRIRIYDIATLTVQIHAMHFNGSKGSGGNKKIICYLLPLRIFQRITTPKNDEKYLKWKDAEINK